MGDDSGRRGVFRKPFAEGDASTGGWEGWGGVSWLGFEGCGMGLRDSSLVSGFGPDRRVLPSATLPPFTGDPPDPLGKKKKSHLRAEVAGRGEGVGWEGRKEDPLPNSCAGS